MLDIKKDTPPETFVQNQISQNFLFGASRDAWQILQTTVTSIPYTMLYGMQDHLKMKSLYEMMKYLTEKGANVNAWKVSCFEAKETPLWCTVKVKKGKFFNISWKKMLNCISVCVIFRYNIEKLSREKRP